MYTIFCDLDGVLADFDAQMSKIGFDSKQTAGDKQLKRHFWATVQAMAARGEPFWEYMDKMSDADMLWRHISKYEPQILSATGHVGNAKQEKLRWVAAHLGSSVTTHLVTQSKDKARFAAPSHVLIDDRAKSIEPWVQAGGIGILHTSASDTIRQLKKLGM